MTGLDRLALSAFLFRFIHANLNAPPFTGMSPPAICHTSYYPVRSSFTSQQICLFLPIFVKNLACMPLAYCLRLLPLLCAAPLSRSSPISTSFCTQAANNHSKTLAIRVTSRPPPLIICKQVHAPAFDYLCIYYPWRYLSRTKKKDLLGREAPEHKKRRS